VCGPSQEKRRNHVGGGDMKLTFLKGVGPVAEGGKGMALLSLRLSRQGNTLIQQKVQSGGNRGVKKGYRNLGETDDW